MICDYKTLILDIYGVIFKEEKSENCDIENLTLDKDFIDFAKKTKEKYQIVLLSNDSLEHSKRITEFYGIDGLFDERILSDETGFKKPSLEIFDAALEKIGRKPSECIFVDSKVKNLLYAEEVGISALLFNRSDEHFEGMTVYSFKELFDIIG